MRRSGVYRRNRSPNRCPCPHGTPGRALAVTGSARLCRVLECTWRMRASAAAASICLFFKEIVDLIVCNSIRLFVRAKRQQGSPDRRSGPCRPVPAGRPDGRPAANPTLVQARKRKDVVGAIAVLGEEAHQCFGHMISANDQPAGSASDRKLGDHALTRLDIPDKKSSRPASPVSTPAHLIDSSMASAAGLISILRTSSA